MEKLWFQLWLTNSSSGNFENLNFCYKELIFTNPVLRSLYSCFRKLYGSALNYGKTSYSEDPKSQAFQIRDPILYIYIFFFYRKCLKISLVIKGMCVTVRTIQPKLTIECCHRNYLVIISMFSKHDHMRCAIA